MTAAEGGALFGARVLPVRIGAHPIGDVEPIFVREPRDRVPVLRVCLDALDELAHRLAPPVCAD